MPMMVVDEAEFEKQLTNVTNTNSSASEIPIPNELPVSEPQESDLVSGEVVDLNSKGRNKGDCNVPASMRSLIAGTAATEGRQEALALAKMFDISPSSVSAYSKGATSTKSYDKPSDDILNFINTRKRKASKKSLLKLNKALDFITDEKLQLEDAKSLASIAKDMGAIVRNMDPDVNGVNGGNTNNVVFQIYRPEIRSEESYEAITVNE